MYQIFTFYVYKINNHSTKINETNKQKHSSQKQTFSTIFKMCTIKKPLLSTHMAE